MSVLPAVVTRNWTLKLASLGLAMFLWAVVRAEPPDRELVADVPVLVQVGDLDWREAAPPEPATVQVRFAGPARQILALNRESAAVRVPLDVVGSPDTTVQLRRDWVVIEGAGGVVVEDVLPSTVDIHLERTARVALPVSLSTAGTPAEGYVLAAPVEPMPPTVRVHGAESRVAALDSLLGRPIDISGMDGVERVVIPIDTTGLTGITLTPTEVEAVVRVERAIDRVLPPVVVEIEGGASGLAVSPERLEITIRGPAGRTSEADLSDLRLIVAADDVRELADDEERRVAVRVSGLDDPFLSVLTAVDSVMVRRANDPDDGGPR